MISLDIYKWIFKSSTICFHISARANWEIFGDHGNALQEKYWLSIKCKKLFHYQIVMGYSSFYFIMMTCEVHSDIQRIFL